MFSYSALRLLNTEPLCSPVLDACAYSFQYSKHRYTAQGRNTARGVPAFSDRLFGKRNPRNLPLKLPSMAGFKRRIIGSVGADHALTHEVQPRALKIVRAVVDEALYVLRRVAEKQPHLARKLSALVSFECLLVSIL